MNRARYLCLCVGLCLPSLAHAHLVSARFGDFYSGLLHPLTSVIHIVPWVALALGNGVQALPQARCVLWLFPLVVGLGVVCGLFMPPSQSLEFGVIVTFGVALVAVAGRTLPAGVWVLLVSSVGVVHGLAHAEPALEGRALMLYAAGVTLAAHWVILSVTATTYWLCRRWAWCVIGVRALGSWVLAMVVLFGGYRLLV
ncbi:HupE/UreJ family protein [Teredinibacter turnerae]|uniref:HupE/UreJ family protein n=1 Tax=Teredinibacter turnerae TaxID=2426 RepID=UPI00048B1BFE|nr:HupE/UreJ family protein [Teredinibacter turnerae]